MNSISLSHISLILGGRAIFRDLSWEIQEGQVVGLIGPNGAGKSSLFKLIMEEYSPEPGGAVVRSRGISVGCLPQEPETFPGMTAFEAALAGNARVAEVARQLEQVENSLGDPAVYGDGKALARALHLQQRLLEEFQSLGAEQYPGRVRELLAGLGLRRVEQDQTLETLSGGQKKLVGLARLILAEPDVLLLDEPDNHLDLSAKVYLERTIQSYKGAVVIISHDRYLLDAVVSHIAELEDGRLSVWPGDYSSYMLAKQERLSRQDELYHVQQRQIARIEVAIKRYALWAKTYDSEKFAKRARAIENRLEKMERVERPLIERRRMDLRLSGWRGSSKVLEFKGAGISFGGNAVIRPADLALRHGERVGLIGANGSGKSVLMKMALGQLEPDCGEIFRGPSTRAGYYAQSHETLDPAQTVLNTVCLAGNIGESSAVSFLNRFLFTYRQASQKVADLSGGERSRLQLALVVLSGANFLLLDEPTNNLDIASAEVLENALAYFEGTALIISHDRYFLDQVADRILVLEDGRLTSYEGGYSDYLLSQK